jgi:hypothetical protein
MTFESFKALSYSLVRKLIAMLAVYAADRGLFTNTESDKIIEGVTLLVISVAWTIWNHYQNQLKIATALQLPAGTSEKTLVNTIAQGKGATS